jgi:hypothetical protein
MYRSTWQALYLEPSCYTQVATRPRAVQPRNRGSILGTDKKFFISPICPDGPSKPCLQQKRGSLFFGIKLPVSEADFSFPFSSVKVKNE